MDFDLTATQQAVADVATSVLDRDNSWKALVEGGVTALPVPERLGGDGVGLPEVATVLTEAGRHGAITPALATLGIIQFMWSWNDFLWPLIIIDSQAHAPLQLGLSQLQGAHFTQWNLLMAGTVMSQIPMLAAFLLAQRWFIRSVAFTGIK